MSAPSEVQRLREATRLQIQCTNALTEIEEAQRRRWQVLHKLAELAGDQFSTTRLGLVEEGLRDQGPPLWFSCLIGIGISLIPVSAITGTFFGALTRSTQKMLTASRRMQLKAAETVFARELDLPRFFQAQGAMTRLADEIKVTETKVANFVKVWEPAAAHTIQASIDRLGEAVGGKQLFKPDKAGTFSQTDVPVVAVKSSLYAWIELQQRAEDTARKMARDSISDLFDIATSSEPGKDAKKKEAAARAEEARREPRVPAQRPIAQLPRSNKEALDELSRMHEELKPTPVSVFQEIEAADLREFQLAIESMIWAMTYDFTPRISRELTVTFRGTNVLQPALLPAGTWTRLTERYRDPDEGKSFAEVGAIDRLGTKEAPYYNPGGRYGPELRLSHYFSRVLYPRIDDANQDIVQRFSHLT